jgi:uncharacterized spore protein YtfJ
MSETEYVTAAGDSVSQMMQDLFGRAEPATVFSEPEHYGDDLVITAAAWERVGGVGFGGGKGQGDEGGGGGGGGGVSQGRPVALIRLSPDRTEVTALPDVTKIAVTVLLSALGVWRALRG